MGNRNEIVAMTKGEAKSVSSNDPRRTRTIELTTKSYTKRPN